MARAALACAIEIGLARGGISGQHIQHFVIRTGAQRIAHLLMKEVREVHDLLFREIGACHTALRGMSLLQERADSISVPILQYHERANKIGSLVGAASLRTVTSD